MDLSNTTEIISKRYPVESSCRFSIIIPTWNNLTMLKLCVDSILKNSRFDHQIILHINEGHDGSREWAEENGLSYTYSSINVGVCLAVNSAASLAVTDYFVYLNDDMYVCPDWDYYLWQVVEQQPDNKFFLSATSIEPRDAHKKVAIAPHNFGTSPATFKETELLQQYADLPMDDWSGASWPPNLLHRSLWEETGGYSLEFFPGFYSDPDFSMKLWQAGVRRFIGVAKSRVYHFLEVSTTKVHQETVGAGRELFLKKWGITARMFYQHYLKMGKKNPQPLRPPESIAFHFDRFISVIKKYIQEIIRVIYVVSLGTTLIGMVVSKAAMSTGEISLASIWLIDMSVNYRRIAERFKDLWKNKAAIVCISFFLLYVIGVLWSENLAFAMRDLRSKLPLFLLPLTIATIKPFNTKELKAIFYMFLAGGVFGTILVLYAFFFKEFTDIRKIIWFNFNIRFGLTILMAVVVSLWCFKHETTKRKYWFLALMAWFTGMLVLMESMTAICILVVLVFFFGVRSIWFSSRKMVKWGMLVLMLAAGGAVFLYLNNIYADFQPKESRNLSELDKTTALGGVYRHDTTSKLMENGYWIRIYICELELRESWNKRSSVSFDSTNPEGYSLRATLIRYLTGKGLRKDAEGVASLSDTDIRKIEQGIANHHYKVKKSSIDRRIRATFWEYYAWKELDYATKTSLTQRFEFWRAALYTIKHNFWFGVGTGDVMDAQQAAYKEVNSLLVNPEVHKTPHNHYLIVFSAFGIFGFAWFMFMLIYPGIKTKRFRMPLYMAFFIVIILSMLVDKLAITYFAVFNTVMLFGVFEENADDKV